MNGLRLPLLRLIATLVLATSLLSARAATLKSSDGAPLAEISVEAPALKITAGNRVITGVAKGDKRRYTASNGGMTLEVKSAEADGFKLRDGAGKLLWKIKIAPAKIKISDNEEGHNAFEIVNRDAGAKIEQADHKLGGATFVAVQHSITITGADGKPAFTSSADAASLAPGVLLLPNATPEQKYIIIAELLARHL